MARRDLPVSKAELYELLDAYEERDQLRAQRDKAETTLEMVKALADGYSWLSEGRGSYKWDDGRYDDDVRAFTGQLLELLPPGRWLGIREWEAKYRKTEEERDRLRAFWDEMRAFRDWANVQFPNSTPQSKAHHLAKEAHELANNPSDPEEMADVLGLFAHLADWDGVDLSGALRAKRLINQSRQWGTPDENGVIEHLRDAKGSLARALEGRE